MYVQMCLYGTIIHYLGLTVPVSRSDNTLYPLSDGAAEAKAANEETTNSAARSRRVFLVIGAPPFFGNESHIHFNPKMKLAGMFFQS
jgi:hypothetical protein